MERNVSQPGPTGADDDSIDCLKGRLKRAERRLAQAQQQASALQEVNRQILTSSSWKITAPLRGVRTLLGAPPPVDLEGPMPPAATVATPEAKLDLGDSLIPATLPATMLSQTPAQAERSNEVCEILELDSAMNGLLSASFLQRSQRSFVPDTSSTSIYFGNESSPSRLAFLGTPELANELAFETAVTALTEANWSTQLAGAQFSMLLIEPVWHVGNLDWRGSLTHEGRGRANVEALLKYARGRGIPCVLWLRTSQEEVEHFAWLTEWMDAVYAVDEGVAAQLQDHTRRTVAVLPAAIQPAIHNPLRSWEQLDQTEFADRVLYDGWLDLLEGAAEDPLLTSFKDTRLLVAESEWEFGGVRLNDRPDFKRNAAGCLTSAGKPALARMVGAEIFRSTPLVPDWRREQMIQRSVACGAIAADSSPSGSNWAGLPLRGKAEGLAREVEAFLVNPLKRARLRQLAFRELFSNHCLADRLNRISSDLGLGKHFGLLPAKVACLLITMRPELLAGCLERFRNDRYPHKELVVVLHGPGFSLADARALIEPGEDISIFQLGKHLSLGDCLNFAASRSDAEYWAKFDDDDLYGPNYLSDIMLYRRAKDFALGGKPAAFIFSEGDGEIRWDPGYARERAWQYRRANRKERTHIAGGTLVGKREVLQEVPFSDVRRRGSDTDLLRRADTAGFDFVAFDFFNFALFRSGLAGFHTWNADADAFKQRTVVAGSASQVESVIHV